MSRYSRPASLARKIIIITFAVLIMAGSFLLLHSLLTLSSASAHGCSDNCAGLTPTPASGAMSITPMPMLTPTPTSCPPAGQQCTGLDPLMTQGCTDQSIYGNASADIIVKGNVVGRIDERYAPACKSWWIRAFLYNGKGVHFNNDYPHLYVLGTTYNYVSRMTTGPGYTEAYTTMFYAPTFPPQNFSAEVDILTDNGEVITQALSLNPVG